MSKIEKKNIQDILALTPIQEGMLFLYLKSPESAHYFEQLSLDLTGEINGKHFEEAWQFVIDSNEMLRTVFRWEKLDNPIQVVLRENKFQPRYVDLSDEIEDLVEMKLDEIKQEDKENAFDLQQVPFRVILTTISDTHHVMTISNHHILYDGWSNGIILKEFFQAYNDRVKGKELLIQQKTKFNNLLKWIKSRDLEKQESYWTNYFKDFDTGAQLSIKRRSSKAGKVVKQPFSFTPQLKADIEEFVKQQKITLAGMLYTVYGILLQQYSNIDDIVFGTVLSGRSAKIKGIEDMVGLVINTLPLRINQDEDTTISQLLARINHDLKERENYETSPLVEIEDYVHLEGQENLFDSVIGIENYPIDKALLKGDGKVAINSFSTEEFTHYDLTLTVAIADEISGDFCYNDALFTPVVIKRVVDQFVALFRTIIDHPDRIVAGMQIVSAEEKQQILHTFNDTHMDLPNEKVLHQLFEEQVEKTPDATALVFDHRQISYGQLNRQANQLAHQLRHKGVGPDKLVGLMADILMETIVGMTAVLKAGGAFLPIDSGNPRNRIQYYVDDSCLDFILTALPLDEGIRVKDDIIHMNLHDTQLFSGDDANPEIISQPHNLAYLIYTSGSTGAPKGVMLEHRNIVNQILGLKHLFFSEGSLNHILLAPFTFDPSVQHVYSPLTYGAKLVMVEKETKMDSLELLRVMVKKQVDIFDAVPSQLNAYLDFTSLVDPLNLKYIILAGEVFSKELREKIKRNMDVEQVINIYGPTEGTINATYYVCPQRERNNSIPIGKPLLNYKMLVLNKHLKLLPIGASGELYISGPGVARGYGNSPLLSSEKFLVNPFFPDEKMYATGDMARWLEDGNLEFVGREDHQVKIRGFRVEMGEIEKLLMDHPRITEAVVVDLDRVLTQDDGSEEIIKYLCGYYVSENAIESREIKEFLAAGLPDYMVPEHYVLLETIPLTAHDKLDRKNLPEPGFEVEDNAPPSSEVEMKLAAIWSDVLKIDPDMIGESSNFFELGGHSLKVNSLLARIHKQFDIRLPMEVVFDSPQIGQLAKHISRDHSEEEDIYASIKPASKQDFYPLSHGQQRLWFVSQMEQGNEAFNMSGNYLVKGDIDLDIMKKTFTTLVQRHDSFRTSIHTHHGKPVQVIAPHVDLEIPVMDVSGKDNLQQWLTDFSKEEAFTPFDLETCPLLRVKILKLAEKEHLFFVTMHHIISDGLSIELLFSQQQVLYDAFLRGEKYPLPPLKLQYKDYAVWERNYLNKEKLEELRAFWHEHLGGKIEPLNLPLDKPRSWRRTFNGDIVSFQLDKDTVQKSFELAKHYNVTLYVLFVTIFKLFLAKICRQQDITVISGIGTREHADLEEVVGLFARGFALQSNVNQDQTFKSFLELVMKRHKEVMAHNLYPFEQLRKEFFSGKDDRAYGFAHFNLFSPTNSGTDKESASGLLDISALDENQYKMAKDDFSLEVTKGENSLHFTLEYNTDLFVREKIQLLAAWLKSLTQQIVEAPNKEMREFYLGNGGEEEIFTYLDADPRRFESFLPLTPTQRDMHLNCVINPDGKAYRELFIRVIDKDIQAKGWKEALIYVHKKYPVLRSSVVSVNENVYLAVNKEVTVTLDYLDLSAENLKEEDIYHRVKSMTHDSNNRLEDPLTYYRLIKVSDKKVVVFLSIHHILCDGVAGRTLFNEAEEFYKQYEADQISTQPVDSISTEFYNHFQQAAITKFDTPQITDYWKVKFRDLQKLRRTLIPQPDSNYVDHTIYLDPAHLEKVQKYCQRNHISVTLYFRSIYGLLIRSYCAVDGDFPIREIADGRDKHTRDLIGCYYQATPLVFSGKIFDPDVKVSNFFQYVRSQKKELGDNQYISIFLQNQLIGDEELRFYYNYHSFYKSGDSHRDALTKIVHHPKSLDDSARMIEFVIARRSKGFRLLLHYNDACFDGGQFLDRVIHLSSQVIEGAIYIKDLSLTLPEEAGEILQHALVSQCDYPRGNTVHQLFREQVTLTPEHTALSFEGNTLTYSQLDAQSDRLAAYLKENYSIGRGDYVALVLQRSEKVVISMLATLKTGAAYVPVDPDYPQDRIKFSLKDSAVKVALFDNNDLKEEIGLSGYEPALPLEEQWDNITGFNAPAPEEYNTSDDAAYVIYTSGSTGRPKGVIVEHDNLVRLFFNDKFQFDFNDTDVWTMFHSNCFDFSVWEMYGALLFGGKLVVIPKMVARDTAQYLQCLRDEKVTILNQTPTAFYKLSQEEMQREAGQLDLKYIIFGGEALHPINLRDWWQRYPETKLINMFGITETTVHVTYYEVTPEDIHLNLNRIGTPIPTTSTYILDKTSKLMPLEMDGEICVAGAGVARGYLNRVELTADKFIENPFKQGDRLYRSGDLGRLSADGQMKYFGRMDFQVQLRGFRIELGEIENQLLKIKDIKEAVVIDRQEITTDNTTGETYLCAYIVSDREPDITSLREQLARSLTDYMIPSYFVRLDKIPVTPNGKVDRKQLPEPVIGGEDRNYTAPRNDRERIMVDIWADILGGDPSTIGIDHDFFELGGHSLKATAVISNIHKTMNVKIPLPVLFETPTIGGLSNYIQITTTDRYANIEPARKKEYYPLSSGQKRLYIIQQLEEDSTSYNLPAAVILEGHLDKERMEGSFKALIQRHESLRTSFKTVDHEPVQQVHEEVDFSVQYFESHLEGARRIVHDFVTVFDLALAPLLRVGLITISAHKYVLVMDMHHLISDALSHRIFIREFIKFYGGEELVPLRLHYKDYSQWQSIPEQQESLRKQEQYWLDTFKDNIPVLELKTDFPRPQRFSFAGADHTAHIDPELTTAIKEFLGQMGITINIFFLAAYNVLLARYTGQDDFVVGTAIAGRRHSDLDNIIGFFANMTAIRNKPTEDKTFEQLLMEVKQRFFEAYENQDAQFDELVHKLGIPRESGRHPLVETVMTVQTEDLQSGELSKIGQYGITVDPTPFQENITHFDLMLMATDSPDSVKINFEYSTTLFKAETIEAMATHFIEILAQVVKDKNILIKDIRISHGLMTAGSDAHRDDDDDWTFDDE